VRACLHSVCIMLPANSMDSVPENSAESAHNSPKSVSKRGPSRRIRHWKGHTRVVVLLPNSVDRAVEVEVAKRNISKRRFFEEALCRELGVVPPSPTRRGVRMADEEAPAPEMEPVLPPAA
jgi:hypothetical protein